MKLFPPNTDYYLDVKIEYKNIFTEWGDATKLIIPEFKEFCAWKECPGNIDENRKFFVDGRILELQKVTTRTVQSLKTHAFHLTQ